MKIRITFDCDESLRRAVAWYYGNEGLASREEMTGWFHSHGISLNDDALGEYQDAQDLSNDSN